MMVLFVRRVTEVTFETYAVLEQYVCGGEESGTLPGPWQLAESIVPAALPAHEGE
jgi:hypothetical protein